MTQLKFEKRVLLTLGAVLTLTLGYATGIATLAAELDKPQRCQPERSYRMVGYTCTNLGLKQIPQTLKSNLQIFDLSFNRIRDLTRQSFARYSDVQYLYLFENMVQFVEPGTFSVMTKLEAIDLSSNALTTIPPELFQMPMLRNLYVAYNNLAISDLNPELPIRAPLQIISLAGCRLNRLPDFGILPDLWLLNISSNPMADLAVEQFAPFCNLKKLDMNDTRVEQCACHEITVQLERRRIIIVNSNMYCWQMHSSEQKSCQPTDSSTDSNETNPSSPAAPAAPFLQCMEVLQSRKLNAKAKAAWFWIALAVLGCILLFCTVLYYVHNRNRKSRKALKNQANNNTKRGPLANGQPIRRIMEPSSPDGGDTAAEDEKPIVENGTRDKLIENSD